MKEDKPNASSFPEDSILTQLNIWEFTPTRRNRLKALLSGIDDTLSVAWLGHGLTGIHVLLAKNGDEESMLALLKLDELKKWMKYHGRIWFIAGSEKEDLQQVMRAGLWKAVCDFNPLDGTEFASFAKVCLERECITAIKTAKRKKHSPLNDRIYFEPELGTGEHEDDGFDCYDTVAAEPPKEKVTRKLIEETLEDLFEGVRFSTLEKKVVVVRAMGLSFDDTAERLGRSFKTVDNALARVKRKIEEACITNPDVYNRFARLCGCTFGPPEPPAKPAPVAVILPKPEPENVEYKPRSRARAKDKDYTSPPGLELAFKSQLSGYELAVYNALAEGRSAGEIAELLGKDKKSVNLAVYRVSCKLDEIRRDHT